MNASDETAGPALFGASHRTGLVASLGLAQILSWGSSFYLAAVLAQPIAASTGWSLGWIGGGVSAGLLTAGLFAPRVGREIDRRGGRAVLSASSAMFAAGLLALGLAGNLPSYFAAWILIGAAMGAGLYNAAFSTLGRMYGQGARNSISVLTLWGGLASTICWPLSAVLVDWIGWRGACFSYAGMHLLVALPLYRISLAREVRASPAIALKAEHGGIDTSLQPSPNTRATLGILTAIFALGGIISGVISMHLLTLLQQTGLSLSAAVALGALIGPAQVIARVVELSVGARHHPVWTLVASAALIAAGIVLLRAGSFIPAVPLIAYGAGNGLSSIARGTVPLALFDAGDYSRLMGWLARPGLVAQAAAPILGAAVLQMGGSERLLDLLTVLVLTKVVFVAFLVWVRRTDL